MNFCPLQPAFKKALPQGPGSLGAELCYPGEVSFHPGRCVKCACYLPGNFPSVS